MNKEAEARVRDELLQSLYASTLRGTLAQAQAGASTRTEVSAGMAAGVCANLKPMDVLLLPSRGAGSLRILRGLPFHAAQSHPERDLAAGVLPLPRDEAAAAAFALGAAAVAAHTGAGALVCVLVPSSTTLAGTSSKVKAKRPSALESSAETYSNAVSAGNVTPLSNALTPSNASTWSGVAAHSARLGLPLLLVSDRPVRPFVSNNTKEPAHLVPAPLFPSIPVDREDALAVYRVTFECASRARAGGGPSHLAGVPFHLRGQQAAEGDTLTRLEAMLRKRGAFHKAWRRQLERQIILELSQT